jgi:hypothetical protein
MVSGKDSQSAVEYLIPLSPTKTRFVNLSRQRRVPLNTIIPRKGCRRLTTVDVTSSPKSHRSPLPCRTQRSTPLLDTSFLGTRRMYVVIALCSRWMFQGVSAGGKVSLLRPSEQSLGELGVLYYDDLSLAVLYTRLFGRG